MSDATNTNKNSNFNVTSTSAVATATANDGQEAKHLVGLVAASTTISDEEDQVLIAGRKESVGREILIREHAERTATQMCEIMRDPNSRDDDFSWLDYEDYVAHQVIQSLASCLPDGVAITTAMKELAQIQVVITLRDFITANFPDEAQKLIPQYLSPEPPELLEDHRTPDSNLRF